MKVKLGDLTARQMYDICVNHTSCDSRCQLHGLCDIEPWMYEIDKEIDEKNTKKETLMKKLEESFPWEKF